MFEAPRQIKTAVAGSGEADAGLAPPPAIDLQKIFSDLWRGRATILWTTAFALLLAVLFVLLVPPQYTAVTQILIDPTDLRAVANELVPASQMSDAAVLQVESQVRVMTSDSVLRRVIRAEGLDRDTEFAGAPSPLRALVNDLRIRFHLGSVAEPADSTLTALNALKRRLQVRRAERTYVVDVSVISRDRDKAARIANAVAQAYLAEQTDARSDAARQVSQSLSARLKELQDRVREAEDRVEAFKARSNIVGAGGQLINEQQLSEMNKLLEVARYRAAESKARYEQVERLQQSKAEIGAFAEAVQSATITALRSQYAEVMRREAEQMTVLGPRHPAVIEIQAQAEQLRGMIREEINRLVLSARNDYESAKANEETLANNLEALKRNAITTNEALVTLRELEREVQANRTVYESFLVRARETGEQERLDTKNIRIISKADPPLNRSFPPSSALLATAALVLGIGSGAGIVLIRGPRREPAPRPPRTTRRPGWRERMRALTHTRRPSVTPPPAVPILATLPAVDASYDLRAMRDPKSPLAKEIGKVYETVRASHQKRGNPSLLVVAAHGEDDEAAAVALTLAALVAVKERVLLVDADLTRRTLAAVFDADCSEGGLVDIAVGRRLLSDVAIRDRETNITMVPVVSPNSRRNRQIRDEDLKVAFAQTKHFEMVIVAAADSDGDPSGRFFAALVDHIVLVAKATDAADDSVEELVARFGLDARKIRGTVLTGTASV